MPCVKKTGVGRTYVTIKGKSNETNTNNQAKYTRGTLRQRWIDEIKIES